MVSPWQGSNKGNTKVTQLTWGIVAIVMFGKLPTLRRGESHFRICSCVHLHVSHVVVHMTQQKSSSVHQDEFWGAFGSRKVRRYRCQEERKSNEGCVKRKWRQKRKPRKGIRCQEQEMSSDNVLASTFDWFLYSFRRPSVGADTVCLVWSSTPIPTTKILLAFKIKNRRPHDHKFPQSVLCWF